MATGGEESQLLQDPPEKDGRASAVKTSRDGGEEERRRSGGGGEAEKKRKKLKNCTLPKVVKSFLGSSQQSHGFFSCTLAPGFFLGTVGR